jgi:MFS family permease
VIATADTLVGAPLDSPRLIDQLLRDRDAMIARIQRGTELRHIMRTMVATIAVAMAIVGATLGSYRGGVQIAFAAIKLPLVLLGTAALSAPALSAIGAALGRRSRVAVDLALVMSALAFGALLLAACTPLVLLGRALDVEYHRMILLVVCMFSIAGIASLRMIVHALAIEAAPGWRTAVVGLCTIFALVGGQLAWALRPYLVRPREQQIVFVRSVEDSLVESIMNVMQSAQGNYRIRERWEGQ